MNQLSLVVLAAITVEAVWESSKLLWQNGRISADRIGALIVGLLIAFGKPLDFYALIGQPFAWPFIGQAFTALVISRGANFVHDLLKLVGNLMEATK